VQRVKIGAVVLILASEAIFAFLILLLVAW
jgi:hypothetical protein